MHSDNVDNLLKNGEPVVLRSYRSKLQMTNKYIVYITITVDGREII